MIITYYGKQFWKIEQGKLVIAFNPVSKSSKSGYSAHFGADIALITTNHPDYNGVEQLSHGDRAPFVIKGPGDYEVKETFIKGVMSKSKIAGKEYINTLYSFTLDGINISFLGTLTEDNISKEAREMIDGPDILFVPTSSEFLDIKTSAKLASSLEPKMIIPMDYDEVSLKAFLKEAGVNKVDAVEKLTLKKKDLEGKEGEIVVFKTN